MATEVIYEVSPLEMERVRTSVKYHEWILGVIIVVMLGQFAYLINSTSALREGMGELRGHVALMQEQFQGMRRAVNSMQVDVAVMQDSINKMRAGISALDKKVNTLDNKVNTLDNKVNTLDKKVSDLDRKMDRYHSSAGS